ncbi:MAG TPA: hypothetical protein VMF67_19180, partial [Rhizomicrobium sp.]|nr:hypothetical protein [Rhizomicrobium sp.]
MNFLRAAAILGAFCLVGVVAAQSTPPSVYALNCIVSGGTGCTTSLKGTLLGPAYPFISIAGYVTPGDGGGGEFYYSPGSCTPDGGTVFTDFSDVNCYYRRFTGTVYMAWFGVQNYSATVLYDVSTSCPSPNTNCFTNAFMAASQPGADNTVSTGGMYLYSSQDVSPPLSNQTLTCNAALTGGEASSNYSSDSTAPGAIVLAHGASIRFTSDNNEFHHCLVLTNGTGTGGLPINLAPTTQRNALDNDYNMVANGDVGIFCDNPENNYIHDVTVIGFDTGVAAWGCSRFTMDHVYIDADVGVYLQSLKSPAIISNIKVKNFLSQNVPVDQYENGPDTSYTVTAIAANPTDGTCVITVSTTQYIELQPNDWVSLGGDGTPGDMGPLSCYGTFRVESVSGTNNSTIDLAGTTYGASISPYAFATGVVASWSDDSSIINVSSVAGIQAGECISSTTDSTVFYNYSCTQYDGTSCSHCVMVKDVSYYSKKIVIANFDGSPAYTQDTSADESMVSVYNYGPYESGSNLYVYATSHIAAGNSIGGAGAGNVATSVMAGGPGDTSPLGFIGNNFYTFAHRNQYNFASAGPALCNNCAFDTQAELFDIQQIGTRFGHGVNPLPLTASLNTNQIDNVTVSTPPFPLYSGWQQNDTVIDSAKIIDYNSGTTICHPVGETDSQLTLCPVPGQSQSHDTIYDVNPMILTGDTTKNSETITNLSSDPTQGSNAWQVGDTILTPQTPGGIPYGTRIVALTSNSVTVDTAALRDNSGVAVADTQVHGAQNTASADFVGSNLGGGGGFVFDALGSGCNSVQGVTIQTKNFGQPALEAVGGCTLLTNISTAQTSDFMIDTDVSNVSLSGSQTQRAGIYFEGLLPQ